MNPNHLINFLVNKTTLALSITTISIPVVVGMSSYSANPPSVTVTSSTQTIAQASTPKPESPTLKNLQSAYNGESNASVMYSAYAKKADEEGYKGVASLFRSAARSEAIHRDTHAKVIRGMGGNPTNKISTPVVKSTQENLAQSIKGESYERDTMYPNFIKQAKAEKNEKAVQTFNYAMEAEAGHAKLYAQAKDNLKDWKQARTFYVCSISGITTSNAAENSCTVNGAKQPVEKVN
jgi:rubrerythrin